MRVAFRVDANEIVATGHLMRCISIAEQVRKQGGSCLFFLAENKCTEILKKRNYEYIVLNSKWDDLEYELDIIVDYLTTSDIDWLIVDSYKITKKYCESLNRYVKTMIIDAPENEVYGVSAILNYSHINDNNKVNELYAGMDILLLIGLKYAPLRNEFFPENQIYKNEKQILITTGGTDPYHIALKMTKAILADDRLDGYHILVVLGNLCSDSEEILKTGKERVTVLQGVSNMSELMQKSMVAFTAGGSTSIELCACGTPTVCFSFADNQIPFSKVLSEHGIITYVGDVRRNETELIAESKSEIERYIMDVAYRDEKKLKMKSVCDGLGAKRIVDRITEVT